MADVFVADRIAPGRTPRRVALKRIRPHLQEESTVVGMFWDEYRLGLACSHPNIVKTLDRGRAGGQPYVVLEYVDGVDLGTLHKALIGVGQRFEAADAVDLCMQVCQALHYLHALKGEEGQALCVVHRDVTPPNVLVGKDGAVKLCDLGLAKSSLQRTLTEPGLTKGKFSYLSPEAALGHRLDARADVFAVGILLWEMLAMRRLFKGKTDYETVKMIQRTHVPDLRSVGADIDDVLQEIVAKALAHAPQERYPSAEALYNALAAYADWQEHSPSLGALVALALSPTSTPVSGIRLR